MNPMRNIKVIRSQLPVKRVTNMNYTSVIMRLQKSSALTVFLSVIMLLALIPSLSASAADSALNDPELNNYIEEYMDAEHTPGLSLVAVKYENRTEKAVPAPYNLHTTAWSVSDFTLSGRL